MTQDPALVICALAALFCAAIAIAVVVLVLRADREPIGDLDSFDPMMAAHGDLPKLPAGSLQ